MTDEVKSLELHTQDGQGFYVEFKKPERNYIDLGYPFRIDISHKGFEMWINLDQEELEQIQAWINEALKDDQT